MSYQVLRNCGLSRQERNSNMMESLNKKPKIKSYTTNMSDSKVKCDKSLSPNKVPCLKSECIYSYQKSKFRRRNQKLSLPWTVEDSNGEGPSCITLPLYKDKCFHETRCSYKENTSILRTDIKLTCCVFDCNHADPEDSTQSSSRNGNIESTLLFRRSSLEKKKILLSDTKLFYNKSSNSRHYLSLSHRNRALLFVILFTMLQHYLSNFTQVESFGHHNRLPSAARLIMKNRVFHGYDMSKGSNSYEKKHKPRSSLPKEKNYNQRSKSKITENNRMQADSPFSMENDQYIWKALR